MRHQLPQRQETHQRRNQVGQHQDDHLEATARVDDQVVQDPQRSTGQRQPDQEGDQSAGVVLQRPAAAADPERQSAVRGRVGHGGHHQRDQVGRLSPADLSQSQVEHEVRERAEHADAAEADQLAEQPSWDPGNGGRNGGVAVQFGPQPGDRDAAGGEAPDQPRHSGQVLLRGGDDVDPAVRVVGPVNRHSWIRRPSRWAITRSSVSKNQLLSCTIGSRSSATEARMALNPHWASENDAASVPFKIKL